MPGHQRRRTLWLIEDQIWAAAARRSQGWAATMSVRRGSSASRSSASGYTAGSGLLDVPHRIHRIRINGAPLDKRGTHGGFKLSGVGREWGRIGIEEFLEYKSVIG